MELPAMVSVTVIITVVIIPRFVLDLAKADSEPDAEGVVGRQERGEQGDPAQGLETWPLGDECLRQNRILGEVARCQREASQRQTTDQHRDGRDSPTRDSNQSREFPQIQLTGKPVHDRSAGQEQGSP